MLIGGRIVLELNNATANRELCQLFVLLQIFVVFSENVNFKLASTIKISTVLIGGRIVSEVINAPANRELRQLLVLLWKIYVRHIKMELAAEAPIFRDLLRKSKL